MQVREGEEVRNRGKKSGNREEEREEKVENGGEERK